MFWMYDLWEYASFFFSLTLLGIYNACKERKEVDKAFKAGFRKGTVEGVQATTNIISQMERITDDEKEQLDNTFKKWEAEKNE